MITPTSGSSRATSSACEISMIVCGRMLPHHLDLLHDLGDRLGPEGVAPLRTVDRVLGDAVAADLVADVLVSPAAGPLHGVAAYGPWSTGWHERRGRVRGIPRWAP